MMRLFGISDRASRKIWDQHAPKALKRPGPRKRANSLQ
jgi:hypothetical protein